MNAVINIGAYSLVDLVQCSGRAGRKHGSKCVHFYWPVNTPRSDDTVPEVFKEIVKADVERLSEYGSADYDCCREWLAMNLIGSSVSANVVGGDRVRQYTCDDIGGRHCYKCVRGADEEAASARVYRDFATARVDVLESIAAEAVAGVEDFDLHSSPQRGAPVGPDASVPVPASASHMSPHHPLSTLGVYAGATSPTTTTTTSTATTSTSATSLLKSQGTDVVGPDNLDVGVNVFLGNQIPKPTVCGNVLLYAAEVSFTDTA